MPVLKRTYVLPEMTLRRFEQEVANGQRSAMVAQLLQEWLDRQQRKRLEDDIVAGCQEMAEVYLETERAFHPLEEEVERALTAAPRTRTSPRAARES